MRYIKNRTKGARNRGIVLGYQRVIGEFAGKIGSILQKNRLGELLVFNNALSPQQLRYALVRQRESADSLGRILIEEDFVTCRQLQQALIQQWMLRTLAALIAIVIAFSCIGVKSARAGSIKDIPAQISLVKEANAAFMPMDLYPSLFGAEERRSSNLEPFTKWTGMFRRFEVAINQPEGRKTVETWKRTLEDFRGLPLAEMAARVNDYINKTEYIEDSRNFSQSDYWETPIEFFALGGDCEDFAIAKYSSLRALGVPEDRLRIAIVHDTQKNIPHAVLIVYTDDDTLVLDNQNKRIVDSNSISRYRPIFSINRQAWWLHTRPKTEVLASAE